MRHNVFFADTRSTRPGQPAALCLVSYGSYVNTVFIREQVVKFYTSYLP